MEDHFREEHRPSAAELKLSELLFVLMHFQSWKDRLRILWQKLRVVYVVASIMSM